MDAPLMEHDGTSKILQISEAKVAPNVLVGFDPSFHRIPVDLQKKLSTLLQFSNVLHGKMPDLPHPFSGFRFVIGLPPQLS